MIPVLPPSAIAQELTACTVLGGCTGVVRAVFPVRGRAAWVPDFLWVGTVLTLPEPEDPEEDPGDTGCSGLPHSGVSGSKMPANYAATQKEPQKSAKRTCQTSAG